MPATATAGTAFAVTVTALDPYGNTAISYRGTVPRVPRLGSVRTVLPLANPCAQIKIYAVRPKGADYQWGEVPPKQLSVGLGSLRASEPGNWPRRSLAIKPTYGG